MVAGWGVCVEMGMYDGVGDCGVVYVCRGKREYAYDGVLWGSGSVKIGLFKS